MPLHEDVGDGRVEYLTDPLFLMVGSESPRPKDTIPDQSMRPEVAYRIISGELMLDGNARQNLATFVTTWMEPEAQQLMALCSDKNMIDKDEYPQTAELERRCVAMLADLWHAPKGDATGCSTIGSSEACMLGGLALKRRWAARLRAQGKDPRDHKPNLVTGINVQVCWEKFANYFEVEPKLVPMEGDRFHLDAEQAAAAVDEDTIGVVSVLGSTFDGSYEPVADIAAALDDVQERSGLDVPVHVDGASGGMVAPFIDPDLAWDFRIPRVASINTSGHKYGRVYPGVGWVVWRDADALPEELVFRVNYLGGDMPTFALNFSRPGAQVVVQYYNFVRLGREGYRIVQQACRDVATDLSAKIADMGPFRLITDGSELPVFAFTTTEDAGFTVFDLSAKLRERGWQVPAYTFPADREDLSVCRIVVRQGLPGVVDVLCDDIDRAAKALSAHAGAAPADAGGFHH